MNAFFTTMQSALAVGQMALGAVQLLGLPSGYKIERDDRQPDVSVEHAWSSPTEVGESEKKLARAQTRPRFNKGVATGSPGFIPQGR